MTDRKLLKEARDLIVMCSLIDKSSQCNDMAKRIDEQLAIPRVSHELPDQKEIIAKAMELAKQGKLLNDKASIKDYLFGFIDGFRFTKQKIETEGSEELLVCDCKNSCDELTDGGEKVTLCEICNNDQVFETEDGYTVDCPRCN